MQKTLVSIICTNYNKGSWISEAVDSFLRQKADFEYEILLIDDQSTDGSRDIIEKYAKKYPNTIRAFYNKKNLGITKTWIKICKEAKGEYIARCDGDDYWIDDYKLQKQVDALKKSGDSKWCCTDYDLVAPDRKVTQKSAVETGFFNRPASYAEMLVTKGMTMASTWLVDAELMRNINKDINETAIDDTFNIQLDLFRNTKLTYLPQATVAYRMNEGSDSKPIDENVARQRDEKLLEAQLEYIKKYKDVEYEDIIKILLHQSLESEDRMRLINRQRLHIEEQERILIEKEDTIRLKEKTIEFKDEEIRLKDRHLSDIVNSKKYKLSKAIAKPFSLIKSILNQRNSS